uniref:Uncharacterized protein B8L3.065 n=1 Tax=Neurospora crassa TaxID=5141 RepID=Q96TZ6_NEUCS|nr:hypothetical protein [Neurospora crassa]
MVKAKPELHVQPSKLGGSSRRHRGETTTRRIWAIFGQPGKLTMYEFLKADIGTYNLYPHVPPQQEPRPPDPPTPDSRPLAWRHAASLELPGGSSLHLIGWPMNPFTDSFPQFAVFHFYHDDL